MITQEQQIIAWKNFIRGYFRWYLFKLVLEKIWDDVVWWPWWFGLFWCCGIFVTFMYFRYRASDIGFILFVALFWQSCQSVLRSCKVWYMQIAEVKDKYSFSSQCSLFIPLENIRKPEVTICLKLINCGFLHRVTWTELFWCYFF